MCYINTPHYHHEDSIVITGAHLSPLLLLNWKGSICPATTRIFSFWLDYRYTFPGGSVVKNLLAMQEMQEMRAQSLGQEAPQKEETATNSSILAWRIPWTEEPGGLQSMGSQRVGHY